MELRGQEAHFLSFFGPFTNLFFSPRFSPASRRNIDSFIFKLLLFFWLFVCNIGWLNSKETPQKTVALMISSSLKNTASLSLQAARRGPSPLFSCLSSHSSWAEALLSGCMCHRRHLALVSGGPTLSPEKHLKGSCRGTPHGFLYIMLEIV